jgi:hypothetical protein
MDDADRAEEKIESQIACGIAHSRYLLAKDSLIACGSCYWCGTGLHAGEIFCDNFCRDDYQKDKRMKQIRGR